MAKLYSASPRYSVTFTVANIDQNMKVQVRTKTYKLKSTVTDYADVLTHSEALADDLVLCTGADLLHKSISADFRGLMANVTGTFDVFKEAALSLNPADGSELIFHTIPAPNNTIVSGSNVQEAAANLASYLDNFEITGFFTLSDGESIAATNQIASSATRKVKSGASY